MRKKEIVAPNHHVPLDEIEFQNMQNTDILQRAALLLRQNIMEMETNKFPENLTVQHLLAEECSIPNVLLDFYITLLSDSSRRRKQSPICLRIATSFAQDVIYAVKNGTVKTSKHVTLGLALKSLTSSRKVIDIFNRYGHCCSYNVIEELETEVTFSSSKRSNICPQDIIQVRNLMTRVAFDNFDRFVDTRNGKDTLHDTVGIIFQNTNGDTDFLPDIFSIEEDESGTDNDTPNTKRRRTFDEITPELEAYNKKPRVVEFLQPIDVHSSLADPPDLKTLKEIDVTWMISHALKIPNTPMWVGFHSKILNDTSLMQKISYLTPINLSPTNTAVVLETMVQSQKVANECNEKYMQVTYDLAIAKIAISIQATEKLRFDNLFINLGSFHIMLAYF